MQFKNVSTKTYRGAVGRGRRPLTSLYEMIRDERLMYVCDLASLASTHFLRRPHTSF